MQSRIWWAVLVSQVFVDLAVLYAAVTAPLGPDNENIHRNITFWGFLGILIAAQALWLANRALVLRIVNAVLAVVAVVFLPGTIVFDGVVPGGILVVVILASLFAVVLGHKGGRR